MLLESKILKLTKFIIMKISGLYQESFLSEIVNVMSNFVAKLLWTSSILSLFVKKNKTVIEIKGLKQTRKIMVLLNNSLVLKLVDNLNSKFIIENLYIVSLVFLPTTFSIAFSVIVIFNSIYRVLQKGASLKLTHIYIAIFLAILLLSGITSLYIKDAYLVSIVYILYIASILLITITIQNKKEIFNILYTLIFVLVICILYGFYQSVVGVTIDPAWVDEEMFKNTRRIFSFFHNPNVYGIFLVLLIPICFGLFMYEKNKLLRISLLLIFFAGIINIFLTMSRGSMVGILIALFFTVVFIDKRFFLIAIIGLLISPFILPSSIMNRVMSIGNLQESSSAYRISIYIASLSMIKDFFIGGVGLGSFKTVYHSYALSASKSFHAHNTFLMIFAENGLFSIILYIIFLISFTKDSLHCVLISKTKQKYIVLGIFSGIVGASVQGLFEHIWHNYDILFLYFLLICVGSSFTSLILQEEENEKNKINANIK